MSRAAYWYDKKEGHTTPINFWLRSPKEATLIRHCMIRRGSWLLSGRRS